MKELESEIQNSKEFKNEFFETFSEHEEFLKNLITFGEKNQLEIFEIQEYEKYMESLKEIGSLYAEYKAKRKKLR